MTSQSNVIAIGLPGKGKSTFLNTIASGNPDSDIFPAGKKATAFTTSISKKEVMVDIPGEEPMPLCIYDVPGLLDGRISLDTWRQMLRENLTGVPIDMLFIVASIHDRVDMGNTMIGVALPFFFEEFDLNRCCLVMTHLDQVDEDDIGDTDEYTKAWLAELRRCAKNRLSSTFLRFDKKRAKKQELGFLGKEPHADEIRRDVIAAVKDSTYLDLEVKFGGKSKLKSKAVYKEPDGRKLYAKLVEVVEPDVLEKAGIRECPCRIS